MAYLHNKKPLCIIHRDLKPANLMIAGSPYMRTQRQKDILMYELGALKIVDYGLSKSLKLQKEVSGRCMQRQAGRQGRVN